MLLIKSICVVFYLIQLKEMKEKLPPEISDSETFKAMNAQAESLLNNSGNEDSLPPELMTDRQYMLQKSASVSASRNNRQYHSMEHNVDGVSGQDTTHNAYGTREAAPQSGESSSSRSLSRSEGPKEVIEQFEPGVFVTLMSFPSGTKIFKRVRFRYLYFFLTSFKKLEMSETYYIYIPHAYKTNKNVN